MEEITNEEERLKNIGDILGSEGNDHDGEKNAYQGEKMTKTSFVRRSKVEEKGQQQQRQHHQQQQQQQPQNFVGQDKKKDSVKMPQTFSDDKNGACLKPGPIYDQVTTFNDTFCMVN